MNKLILFTIVIWLYALGDLIYKNGLIIGCLKFVLYVILLFSICLLYKKYEQNVKVDVQWKILKSIQITAFSLFGIWLIIGRYIPSKLSQPIFMISIIGILLSILIRRFIPKKTKADTLEEQIKNDLKITATTKTKKFPKGLRWIGGFVLPSAPFFLVLNKKWKKKLTKEAIIHEHIHLHYLQNGAILVFVFGSYFFVTLFKKLIPFLETYITQLVLVYAILMMVYFEYITFNRTNKYGDKLGIKTRKWNKNICFKYLFIYTINLSIILIVFYSIKYLFLRLIG